MLNTEVKDAQPVVTYACSRMDTMGDRIQQLRQAKSLTQQELAELVGVTKSAVSQWENGGTANVKLDVFLRLCDVLGTFPHYLVFGTQRDPAASGKFRKPGNY